MNINALQAYNQASNLNISNAINDESIPNYQFTDMVKNGLNKSIDTLYKGEEMSIKALTETVDLRDVILATTNAELALETIVTLRDKMVSAYQEVLKMPL